MGPNRTSRIVIWGLGGAILLAGGALVATSAGLFGPPSCGHKIVREYPSPNGHRVAMVILTNCGATTPFVSSVAMKYSGEKFDLDKNFFLEKDFFFSVKGLNDIQVHWNDNSDLTIIFERPELIYRQAIVWRTDRISYQEKS
jgi:hypothetical protein